ncbi:MAG: ECF transporter S component [Anaerovibrio sp.]|uniref:ECF transporter S component n=1 Tax=Anaerovibrio sp. TaxID=1872532 RepID=UPI0025F4DC31|nr:ECF transporter S component [Anaerovibrio sp.]MCR5177005.1 ECF transporter S component [Anaerovibrio sp.]
MRTKKIVFAGLFIAVGVLLPIAFHMLGASGRLFLPMHIPVLMGGLLLGPVYGLAVGVAVPVISSLVTGMPPVFPILPMMTAELATYGFLSGFLYKKCRLRLFVSMLGAMVAGRITCILMLALFAEWLQIKADPVLYVLAGIWGGAVGIVMQLVLIPILVGRLKVAFGDHDLF